LGSGSDYSAYLQHLGLPALDIGFSGEEQSGGVYHSLYDSFHHMTTFDDPGLKYGAALSKISGRIVLRLADADTPPMRFGDFADTVAAYLGEVAQLADKRRTDDGKRAKLVRDGTFQLASDPLHPVAAPEVEASTPHIELAALANAVDRLKMSAQAFDAAYAANGTKLAPARRTKLNALLRDIDQLLIDDRGLPGRPWYKNLIYAPGRLTGYGAKTLPGVREAIEERRFDDANLYAARTAKVIDKYAERLDQARAVVEAH
jgi:N-acetylated-alpha-linked acidic dipeptidase